MMRSLYSSRNVTRCGLITWNVDVSSFQMDAALLTASESMSSSYSSNSQSQSSSTEIQILDGSIQNVPVKPAACIQMEFRTMSPQRASTGALTLPGTLALPDRGGDINQAIHMPKVQMEPWQMDFSDGYITGPVSVARLVQML